MRVEDRESGYRRLRASFSKYVLDADRRDLGDRIVDVEIPELGERYIRPYRIEHVHLEGVVKDPISAPDGHLPAWKVIVETEAWSEIIEVAVDCRSVHPILAADEEPSSRVEIRDAIVLVVWVA